MPEQAPPRSKAQWLVEHGIGEDRAVLVDRDKVVAARIRQHGRLSAGLVADAKLIAKTAGARRGTLLFDNGEEALVDGLSADAREGARLRAVVTRAAIAETGRYKRAQARFTSAPLRPALDLAQSLAANGTSIRSVRRFPDDPWPEIVEEALSGSVAFPEGSLIVSPTPAMTLIDIDGALAPLQLAMAAIPAIAAVLGRLDLAGSIGIDFPTIESRADRRQVDDALRDALAGWPHERTAMNGFGFVQIVARLERASILSAVHSDPARAGAMLLLRRLEDVSTPGILLARAHPDVIASILPAWRAEIMRRTGRQITWQDDPTLAPLSGFAQAITP